ncbi:PDZ domain-containing protein [Virgibacillus doumboii]|uniref:PDZ domain-containing protein n=1 Tax=Virgibacillus doumboii TaxID=2697503 RepID=UPI0013DE9CA9|nr:PDZ domain-containing protein [Virgibacillus doumboii]
MAEAWLIEAAKGLGRLFLNPLLYWVFILVLLAGYRRIRKERLNFGFKLFDVFSEWKNTWAVSVISGVLISLAIVGAGMVFSYETILLLCLVTIVLSLTLRFTLLSASYTVGITYLILLFMPYLLEYQNVIDTELFGKTNFTGLSLLLAIFLLVESILLKRSSRNSTFPDLELGRRGIWIGSHHIKKLALIPFFVVIPSGLITPFAPFWPYFSLNGGTYSLLLVPFLIGVDHIVKASLPEKAANRLARSIQILSLFVLLFAVGSIYISWLSLGAVVVGIIGREFINYRHRLAENEKSSYFNRTEHGLKVLAIIPGTPADRLGILVGETIKKVNGRKISSMNEFYYALQDSGAFFKLEIVGDNGEVRFVQSALYEEDHHELGVITTDNRYREKQSEAN